MRRQSWRGALHRLHVHLHASSCASGLTPPIDEVTERYWVIYVSATPFVVSEGIRSGEGLVGCGCGRGQRRGDASTSSRPVVRNAPTDV